MNSGKVLLGVLAGVAVGAMAGILLAPDKGSVTRKKILKKSDEYADALRDKFNEYMDTISEKIDTVDGGEYADSLNKKFEEFLESISEKYEAVKEDVSAYAGHKNHKPDKNKSDVKTAKA
jgi:gas vesicle protein